MSITPTEALEKSQTYQAKLDKEAADQIIAGVTTAMGLYYRGKEFVYAWHPADDEFNKAVLERVCDFFSDNWTIQLCRGRDAYQKAYKAYLAQRKKRPEIYTTVHVLVFTPKQGG